MKKLHPLIETLVQEVCIKYKTSPQMLFGMNPTRDVFYATNELVWRIRTELMYNGSVPNGNRIAKWTGASPHTIWRHIRRGDLRGKESDPVQRTAE